MTTDPPTLEPAQASGPVQVGRGDVKTHTLYRFYDAAGRLLYVGITANPITRFKQHRREKPWWLDVAEIKMQQFASRPDLENAERQAIRDERPLWNVIYAKRDVPSTSNAPRSPESRPKWRCHGCGTEIVGVGAAMFLSRDERMRADACRQWWEQYEYETYNDSSWQPIDLDRIMSAPDEGAWTSLCATCIRENGGIELLDNSSYFFDISRANTWQRLMSWTVHLMEKKWFNYTNWRYFMIHLGAKE